MDYQKKTECSYHYCLTTKNGLNKYFRLNSTKFSCLMVDIEKRSYIHVFGRCLQEVCVGGGKFMASGVGVEESYGYTRHNITPLTKSCVHILDYLPGKFVNIHILFANLLKTNESTYQQSKTGIYRRCDERTVLHYQSDGQDLYVNTFHRTTKTVFSVKPFYR